MWLVAVVLDSADSEGFHHQRRFYGTARCSGCHKACLRARPEASGGYESYQRESGVSSEPRISPTHGSASVASGMSEGCLRKGKRRGGQQNAKYPFCGGHTTKQRNRHCSCGRWPEKGGVAGAARIL